VTLLASALSEFMALGDRQQLLANGGIREIIDSRVQASDFSGALTGRAVLRDGHCRSSPRSIPDHRDLDGAGVAQRGAVCFNATIVSVNSA
jgi:hypothetical protein